MSDASKPDALGNFKVYLEFQKEDQDEINELKYEIKMLRQHLIEGLQFDLASENEYTLQLPIKKKYIGLAIGKQGANIQKARKMEGIHSLELDEQTSVFTIIGKLLCHFFVCFVFNVLYSEQASHRQLAWPPLSFSTMAKNCSSTRSITFSFSMTES